ncbi:MAG: ABC transporter ATP-binding protein [Planctomycetota bacterium]|jgi:ABC-type methionine transport system ATPase subunit
MSALLGTRGLRGAYNGRTVAALDELDVAAGEAVALVGANGSGKSTLLRLLALLERPSAGSVSIAGRTVNGDLSHVEARRDVTLVLPQPWLFATTAKANVERGLAARGVHKDERARRADEALAVLGLEDVGPRDARELSSGETARVGLARALVMETPVLLLDEPFLHLDPEAVEPAVGAVRRRLEAGAAVVMAGVREEDLRGVPNRVVPVVAP